MSRLPAGPYGLSSHAYEDGAITRCKEVKTNWVEKTKLCIAIVVVKGEVGQGAGYKSRYEIDFGYVDR